MSPRQKPAKTTLLTRPQLAKVLRVHPGTITRWERDGMPVAKRATRGRHTLFDQAAVEQWQADTAASKQGDQAVSLGAERAALARIQAERIGLQNAARRGELLEVSAVAEVVGEMLASTRSHLLALPTALAETIVAVVRDEGARGVERVLREEITGALRELAAWRPPTPSHSSAAPS